MVEENDIRPVKFVMKVTGIKMNSQTQCMSGVHIPMKTNLCHASYVRGWNICLWGKSKLTIVCGNCDHLFKTRDYIPRYNDDQQRGLAAQCPGCSYLNWMNMEYK